MVIGLVNAGVMTLMQATPIIKVYQVVFSIMVAVGATTSLDVVWDLADTFNGLMVIPDFIALFALSGVVTKLTKEHFSKNSHKLK